MKYSEMKYLSLFSGIGGFERAIEEASLGLDCIGYSEVDNYAIKVYNKHFNHKNYGDVTKINVQKLPNFDLIVGGFPCQSFSVAGKRRGFKDTRGSLFFNIAKIARVKQPRFLLLENVKGLLSHNEGDTFTTILATLDELGYDCQWQVLNSKNFGVPQDRERVFIVGHLRGTPRPKVFPFGETNKESGAVLPSERVQNRKKTRTNYVKYEDSERSVDSYINSNNWQDYIFDSSHRILTPKEFERLQGFPDDWTKGFSDRQRKKMCGNAVTVPVVKEILKRLI